MVTTRFFKGQHIVFLDGPYTQNNSDIVKPGDIFVITRDDIDYAYFKEVSDFNNARCTQVRLATEEEIGLFLRGAKNISDYVKTETSHEESVELFKRIESIIKANEKIDII